jgi:hypothetical protein
VTNDETLDLFYGLFRGNASFYVKHQAPFTKKEGKLTASWCGFAVYNKHTPPPKDKDKEIGDAIPVTKDLYKEHLNGGNGLAIAPLTDTQDARNVCFYAVIDIDTYGVDFTWLVCRLYQVGFKFAAFLSKSGGLHIYFFFCKAEPGEKVIATLKRIVEVYGLERLYTNEKHKSKVEIFPKQAVYVPGDTKVNCLLLPFYNTAHKSKQNMLTAEGRLVGIVKALPIVEGMLTSTKDIEAVLAALPYSDAPYCVQAVLLAGTLAENDGRNNFLFHASIYLKKKYKDDFKAALQEMNDCLEAPLPQKDIDSIYTSVTTKSYDNYSCTKAPCADYCDKKHCMKREFGKGRQGQENYFTGADSWGMITKYLAKDAYYVWEVRVAEGEDYRKVRFNSESELLDQRTAQTRCLRDLAWVPATVKRDVWDALVTSRLEGVRSGDPAFNVVVSRTVDTTGTGMLYSAFARYLTHRQMQDGQPYMIQLDRVYRAEGAYYFTTEGITNYLRQEKFSLRGINLREELVAYGCAEGEVKYKTAKGEEKTIKCWKKPEDAELLEMDAFYEDVYEGDAEILRRGRANKEQEGKDVENTKF